KPVDVRGEARKCSAFQELEAASYLARCQQYCLDIEKLGLPKVCRSLQPLNEFAEIRHRLQRQRRASLQETDALFRFIQQQLDELGFGMRPQAKAQLPPPLSFGFGSKMFLEALPFEGSPCSGQDVHVLQPSVQLDLCSFW